MPTRTPKKPAPKKPAPKAKATKPVSQNPQGGEGDYASAERYQREAQAFAQSGRVEPAATAAREAVESDEAGELEAAEAEGRSRSKGDDR